MSSLLLNVILLRKSALDAFLLFSVVSCKTDENNQIPIIEKPGFKTKFHKRLTEVFKTHNGLEDWKNIKSLSFSLHVICAC